MLSRYPGHGVGFKVQRKWWPEGTFMHVRQVDLFAPRFGRVFGILYKDGKLAGNKIERVEDALKRGMWKYSMNDAAFTEPQVTLDNGLTFDLALTQ